MKKIKKIKIGAIFTAIMISILITSSLSIKASSNNITFIKGVDCSSLKKLEDKGAKFYDAGKAKDALDIFKNNGVNYVRLRIWVNPTDGYCDKKKTLYMAKRIKAKGLKLLLDFHYTDTWADPNHQTKPKAWESLSYNALKTKVYNYTKDVMSSLDKQGTFPDLVQVGNEIGGGMLWDDGKIYNNNSENWDGFIGLLNSGIKAVRSASGSKRKVQIIIHTEYGGKEGASEYFYNKVIAKNVDFDIIGLSYYPWWDGSLDNLKNNVNNLAEHYNKKILITETAYPWTLSYNDNVNNIVGEEKQLLSGYPATVEGQKKYMSDLIEIIKKVPNSKGLGVVYWEPDIISVKDSGCDWENLAMFDFNGNKLDSLNVFKEKK